MSQFDLSGRRAVVTGASSGIGQATAIALAGAGADIASLHLPNGDAEATAKAITALGRNVLLEEGTTADPGVVEAFAERVEREVGPIDIWVNNAARLLIRPFDEMSEEEWRDVLEVNLQGYYNGCRSALKRMAPRGRGRVINVSSVTADQPISGLSAYVTAKGGVVGLTRSLALEFGPSGITVNAIAPGAIRTALNAAVYTAEVERRYEERIALARIGAPDDIAWPIVFLASDAARYITGQHILVDGGLALNGNMGFGG